MTFTEACMAVVSLLEMKCRLQSSNKEVRRAYSSHRMRYSSDSCFLLLLDDTLHAYQFPMSGEPSAEINIGYGVC